MQGEIIQRFDGLDSPAEVMRRLALIEGDLAIRQNLYEHAAGQWYTAQRAIKLAAARALLTADERSVTEKKARADLAAHAVEGAEHEAEYVAVKAAIRVLETRASICMSLLKAQGRS